MFKEEKGEIKINQIKDKEYIIQDKFGISLGRIFLVEINQDNKYCCLRISFYKNNKEHSGLLKKALELVASSLFNNMKFYKINVITDEDIIVSPFVELGFILEGVLWGSYILNNIRKNEFIFGVEIDDFKKNNNINILRLKGKNIELKILTPEDAEQVLDYYLRNKNYLEPFEPSRDKEFYTLDGQIQGLSESYKQFLNGTSVNFGIYENKNLIGKIQLSNIIRGVFQNSFVGYSIDERKQGKGYMKEALRLVLDYAFDDMELHRVEASTLVDNIKSQRVLKECGFKDIGVSEKYLYINGKWRDHKTFYRINN